MSWEDMAPQGRPSTVTLAIRQRRDTGVFYTHIRIGAQPARDLGWQRGEKVKLLIGEGGDAGSVKLRRGRDGDYTLFTPNQGDRITRALAISTRLWSGVPQAKHAATSVRWMTIAGGTVLVFELPDWARPQALRRAS